MIQYKYTANVSSTYTITYTDASSVPQTISFTGTTWSQSQSVSVTNFEQAFFSVNCTASPTPTLTGKMIIYANNKDVQDINVPLTPGDPTSFSISYLPFEGH